MTDVTGLRHHGRVPIQDDRDAECQHVTIIPARVIAHERMTSLAFHLAAEWPGPSPAIVSTYFTGKRDLLVSALRAAATRTSVRFEPAATSGGLQKSLEAWLPLDDERLTDWRVIIAFWGVAVAGPELAQIQ